jgi:peptide/nickel transport system substrate-binding protein
MEWGIRVRAGAGIAALAALALAAGCYTTGGGSDAGAGASARACACPELTAPSEDRAPPPGARRGGTVAMAIASEPSTLLSMYSADPAALAIADHDVLEALTVLDPASGEPLPELAARWESGPGAGLVTFHLVRDARWHDGVPFSAADVKFTFDQLLDPAGGALLRGDFLDVREVTAVDASTVAVRLDRDRPDLPAALSRVPILPQHVFGKDAVATHAAARAPIGTGPFRFATWRPGVRIELERNPLWRGEAPLCDRLVYRFVTDQRAALDMFREGLVDVVPGIGGFRLGEEHLSRGRRIAFPLEAFVAVVYNAAHPIFADAATRRALGLLLDRAAIRCSALRCLAADVFDPWPGSPGSAVSSARPAFDPAGARRLLAAAGWRDADGDGVLERRGERLSFRFLLPYTDREAVNWVSVFEADLAASGVETSIASVGWGVYTDRLRSHRFDAAIVTTPNARPFDARALYHSAAAASGSNFGAFSDPRMDAALDGLAAATTAADREAFRGEVEALLETEAPVTFAFRPGEALLVRDSIRGARIRGEWLDERRLWLEGGKEGAP